MNTLLPPASRQEFSRSPRYWRRDLADDAVRVAEGGARNQLARRRVRAARAGRAAGREARVSRHGVPAGRHCDDADDERAGERDGLAQRCLAGRDSDGGLSRARGAAELHQVSSRAGDGRPVDGHRPERTGRSDGRRWRCARATVRGRRRWRAADGDGRHTRKRPPWCCRPGRAPGRCRSHRRVHLHEACWQLHLSVHRPA